MKSLVALLVVIVLVPLVGMTSPYSNGDLKTRYEAYKLAGYSQWGDGEAQYFRTLSETLTGVFASKLMEQKHLKLAAVELTTIIPKWAKAMDIVTSGYAESTINRNGNSGHDGIICKITAQPNYLFISIKFKAECVEFWTGYSQFVVEGTATRKDLSKESAKQKTFDWNSILEPSVDAYEFSLSPERQN